MSDIKEMRRKAGFTQEELAAKLGVVRSTIYNWEKGTYDPPARVLPRYARALKCGIPTLIAALPDRSAPSTPPPPPAHWSERT